MAPTNYYGFGNNPVAASDHAKRNASSSAAYLLPHIEPHMHILDVGCGPGSITSDLAKLASRTIGVDANATVIEAAQKLTDPNDPDRLQFQTADVYNLPFSDASFDLVHAHQVLIHLPDPVAALREMKRVLKPGGIVAVREGDWSTGSIYPELVPLFSWKKLMGDLLRANGSEPDAGRRLQTWTREAGFDPKGRKFVGASAMTMATPQERATWAESMVSRVGAADRREKAVKLGLATDAEIDAIAQAWKEWSQHEDGWWSSLCGEIICKA